MVKRFSFMFLICTILIQSCQKKDKKMVHLQSNTELSQLLENKESKLLLITQPECKACSIVVDRLNTDMKDYLPEDMKIYSLAINDVRDKNIWLFHVLENYSYPLVVLIDKENNIQAIHKGGDAEKLDTMLKSFKNDETLSNETTEMNNSNTENNTTVLKLYLKLRKQNKFTAEDIQQIRSFNKNQRNFISILLEAYSYQQNNIYPERIKHIKNMLLTNDLDSNSFYFIQKPFIDNL